MNSITKLKVLQIKKQPFLHLFPILFVYFLIAPYCKYMILDLDEINAGETFRLVERLVIIFSIWYQFFDFQMFFWKDIKEISFTKFIMPHFHWFIFSRAMYICLMLPFWIYFQQTSQYFKNSIAVFVIQVLEVSLITFFLMEKLRSSLIGTVCGICYLFVSINEITENELGMVITGMNPCEVPGQWFILHGIIIGILLILGRGVIHMVF